MNKNSLLIVAFCAFIFSGCEKTSELTKVASSKISSALPTQKMTASRWANEVVDGTNFGTDEYFKLVDNEAVNKAAKSGLFVFTMVRGVYYKRASNPRVAENWGKLIDKTKEGMAVWILQEVGNITKCEEKLKTPQKGSSITPFMSKGLILNELASSGESHLSDVYKLTDELIDICISVSPGYENILERGYRYPLANEKPLTSVTTSKQNAAISSSIADSSNSLTASSHDTAAIKLEQPATVPSEPKNSAAHEHSSDTLAAAKQPIAQPTQDSSQAFREGTQSKINDNAFTPSFDCGKANTGQERLVCSDRELSKLDVELSVAYALARENAPDKTSLRENQIRWLKFSRNACSDKECLVKTYRQRINELSGTIQSAIISKSDYVFQDNAIKGGMTISKLKDGRVIVNVNTVRPNGNVCNFEGTGKLNGSKLLAKSYDDDALVEIQIHEHGAKIVDSESLSYFCGMNAYFSGDYLLKR